MDREVHHLEMDLLLPSATSPSLSIHDLSPLLLFRQLRSLKITSIMKAYQRQIWKAVWLNPQLRELTLETAIKPAINSVKHPDWVEIEGDWKSKKLNQISLGY